MFDISQFVYLKKDAKVARNSQISNKNKSTKSHQFYMNPQIHYPTN